MMDTNAPNAEADCCPGFKGVSQVEGRQLEYYDPKDWISKRERLEGC